MKTDLQKAEYFWANLTGFLEKDRRLPLIADESLPLLDKGCLRACREALLLGQDDIANRLKITRQGYAKLEQNELHGKITLESLRNAAAAMDCEVFYWIQPKSKKPFSTLLWEQILPKALKIYKVRMRTGLIKPMVLARIAFSLLKDPQCRQELGWSRNTKS